MKDIRDKILKKYIKITVNAEWKGKKRKISQQKILVDKKGETRYERQKKC